MYSVKREIQMRWIKAQVVDNAGETTNVLAGSRVPMVNTSVSAVCAPHDFDEKGFS
jgi:hypothetical protein